MWVDCKFWSMDFGLLYLKNEFDNLGHYFSHIEYSRILLSFIADIENS